MLVVIPAALVTVLIGAGPARAGSLTTFSFEIFEDAPPAAPRFEIDRMFLDVVDEMDGTGRFDFRNTNDPATSGAKILAVYFEDGLEALIEDLVFAPTSSSSSVSFNAPNNPGSPPGGQDLTPAWLEFAEEKKSGCDAILPGMTGSFTFDFAPGATYAQVLAVIPDLLPVNTNTGRIAIHVGGVDPNSQSISAVAREQGLPSQGFVPLPSAAWMGLGLLAALAAIRALHRRRARPAPLA